MDPWKNGFYFNLKSRVDTLGFVGTFHRRERHLTWVDGIPEVGAQAPPAHPVMFLLFSNVMGFGHMLWI